MSIGEVLKCGDKENVLHAQARFLGCKACHGKTSGIYQMWLQIYYIRLYIIQILRRVYSTPTLRGI